MKTHKVGTLTLGVTLISSGILFLLHFFSVTISYEFILRLWPIMFIFLGLEVLYHYFRYTDEKLEISGGSIFILFLVSCFAMAMAFMDITLEYVKTYGHIIW